MVNDGACNVADASVTARATNGLAPGLEPVCPAAALPADPEALWFDPDRLLEVEITMQKADWDAMRVQERNLYAIFVNLSCGDEPFPDPYTYFHADVVVEGQPLADVGIRKKGFFGSLSQTKPSLKLDFGEFVSGQRLEGLDRMTLNNALQDPAYVKQCLGYEIMASAGIPAPRCNFARVTVHTLDGATQATPVDGQLYVNVESIKPPGPWAPNRHMRETLGYWHFYQPKHPGISPQFGPGYLTVDYKTSGSSIKRTRAKTIGFVRNLASLVHYSAHYTSYPITIFQSWRILALV